MLLQKDKMNKNSRVWVYTSNREFTSEEMISLNDKLSDFTQNWLSHGDEVKASYSIPHNHFIVLMADEKEGTTGGCSIDSAFKFIKQLEEDYSISLLDRQLLSFLIDTKVIQIPFKDIKSELKNIKNTDTKYFFNNLVENLEQLETNWLVEPENSWIKNHL